MNTDVKHYTKTQLKKERGWTDAAITHFLGEPDKFAKNPYSSRSQVHLYDAKRVEEVEASYNFEVWRMKSEKRRAAAARAVETKRAKTLAKVAERIDQVRLTESASGLSKKKLRKLAVEHYNDYQELRALEYDYDYDFDPVAVTGADQAFYERIEVNYLRHEGTEYDEELETYIGATGVRDAVDMVREHVYGLIAAEYPHLNNECDRQLDDRRNMELERQVARGGGW